MAYDADADLALVTKATRRIKRREAAQAEDYALRVAAYDRLLANKAATQAHLARIAGVTQMAVKFAVDDYRKKQRK